ncbi:hypothetical protein I302_103715 [Kwoniella bestiolae CBS 10118]|uniref:BAG domain-containing protein n=1 Tax=Kwoniella bestiolae CBS 10118 TaxID=1296100 RepID=A0AAJ8M8N9_9TREE
MFPHPYFTHPHPAQHRRAGFATPSPAYPHPHPGAQQFNFFPSPPTPHASYEYASIEEEERAALAHLRSIQRRREEAEAAAAREAALAREAAARAEREVAIRAELARIERQQQVAQAIRAQQQAEEDRQKRAYLEAIERKRNEIVSAQLAARARRQAALAASQARREEAEARRQEAAAYVEARRQAALARGREAEARGRCAQGRCHRRSAPTSSSAPTERNEWQDLNNIFGPLFGFQLVPDAIAETDNTPTTTGETTSQTRTAPAEAPTASPAPSPAPVAEKKDKREFPEDINNLLSQFLGLRVDPVSESGSSTSADKAKATGNGIPEGLNEFLGQFGLVFEPESTSEEKKSETPVPVATEPAQEKSAPVASASTNIAQPATTSTAEEKIPSSQKDVPPFTSLLEHFTDVNPLLRDLLGNFEHALTDELTKKNKLQGEACQGACERQCARSCEKQDKGKARAEGERKEVPKSAPASTPAPIDTPSTVESTDSSSSITALDSIESQLDTLRSSFQFPAKLSFAHSTSESISPPLLFNKTNSAYHTQANSYLQLLLKADGITSNGDKEIRKRRKELVSKVEKEIENLEKQKDEIWKEVKAKRDNGEESEPDEVDERSWSGSETTSVAGDDHIPEHKEEVEVEHVEHSEDQQHDHKSYADVAKAHSTETVSGARAEPTSTADQPTPTSAVDQREDANDSSAEQPPKEETEGYTITVTFPNEVESVEQPQIESEEKEKKEVKGEEGETTKEVVQPEQEQDKRSDKSARVETEEEEAKEEEGYELV